MINRTEDHVQTIIQQRQVEKDHHEALTKFHKETVARAIAEGVRFVHARNIMADGEDNPKGGCTICYKPLGNGTYTQTNLFEMSIALCNPNDLYSRELGRYHAAANFLNKSTIVLRRPNKNIHYSEFIKQKFSEGEYF